MKGMAFMYQRITNLSDKISALKSPELEALAQVWKQKKIELEKSGEYQEFIKKLHREWAIETGIVERLYTWDRGVTEFLIEQGIDAAVIASKGGLQPDSANDIKNIINDQLEIVDGLFSFVKGEQPLTEHYIRQLQAKFTAHQDTTEGLTPEGNLEKRPLLKGEYKKELNNPRRPDGVVHEYCPPLLVKEEMECLISWYQKAATSSQVSPEVLAAWLHHRFTQIHPFQDGNGRVARTLATIVFLKEGLFPLVICGADEERKSYIGALEKADAGDLEPLISLFVNVQRKAILHAIGLEQKVQQDQYADMIMRSALQVLKDKFQAKDKSREVVYTTADALQNFAAKRLEEFSNTLDTQLREVFRGRQDETHLSARSSDADNDSDKRHYFYKQIVDIARKFNYYANTDRYRSWVRLSIVGSKPFEFVVSFHGYGYGNNGIMVASAFTFQKVPKSDEEGVDVVNLQAACTDLFQFNYAEKEDSTKKRFRDWLESSLAIALAEWKRGLA
jgi:Fic family protein